MNPYPFNRFWADTQPPCRSHSRFAPVAPASAREATLTDARVAIRLGLFAEAEAALRVLGSQIRRADADCLNLLGVLAEARQDWRGARRSYGRAVRVGGEACAAAMTNVRRLYELNTFGRTAQCVALGDEAPAALVALIAATAEVATMEKRS